MKRHGISSSCPAFTVANLHLDKAVPPSFEIGKAANIKHALLFCSRELPLCSCSVASNSEVELAATCLWALDSWIQITDSSGMILSEAQAEECMRLGRIHLKSDVSLAKTAFDAHVLRWKVRPKLHYLDHWFRAQVNLLNPRIFQCYGEEDLMGRVARLAAQVHRNVVGHRTLMRYCLLLSCRWHCRLAGNLRI